RAPGEVAVAFHVGLHITATLPQEVRLGRKRGLIRLETVYLGFRWGQHHDLLVRDRDHLWRDSPGHHAQTRHFGYPRQLLRRERVVLVAEHEFSVGNGRVGTQDDDQPAVGDAGRERAQKTHRVTGMLDDVR